MVAGQLVRQSDPPQAGEQKIESPEFSSPASRGRCRNEVKAEGADHREGDGGGGDVEKSLISHIGFNSPCLFRSEV